jgi:pseudaminic acid synthase
MHPQFTINGRQIGPGQPTYVIAEMSGNHRQDFEQAVSIMRAAKEAGADAVKLQTYTAETITMDCDSDLFRIGKGSLWEGKNLYELYGEAFTPWAWQPKLKRIADELNLTLFSTPFDDSAVDFLEEMQVPAHKIASFELVDTGLLRKVARTGKPVIMSTGMASLDEIDCAVRTLRNEGCTQLALLKCTSAYPSPPEEMNLRTIPHLAEAFGTPVGISDHTVGISAPVVAVTLGACIVEKHLTLNRNDGGPDAAFSLEPVELKAMVDAIRVTEKALGQVSYEVTKKEAASRVFRRSLFVVANMKKGEAFTAENVRSIRPSYGLSPKHLSSVLGRYARRDITRGTPLSWDCLDT